MVSALKLVTPGSFLSAYDGKTFQNRNDSSPAPVTIF